MPITALARLAGVAACLGAVQAAAKSSSGEHVSLSSGGTISGPYRLDVDLDRRVAIEQQPVAGTFSSGRSLQELATVKRTVLLTLEQMHQVRLAAIAVRIEQQQREIADQRAIRDGRTPDFRMACSPDYLADVHFRITGSDGGFGGPACNTPVEQALLDVLYRLIPPAPRP